MILGNRHIIVIDNNDQISVKFACIVKSFQCLTAA